jgi:hypothetical protein
MLKIYKQSMTGGRKSHVVAYCGIFSSISEIEDFRRSSKMLNIFEMLKNHSL